jgi:hypothetical protein
LGHANLGIVIAGKLAVTCNDEVGIRGLVIFGLGFQIGDALVVVYLPEAFHTSLAFQFHENLTRKHLLPGEVVLPSFTSLPTPPLTWVPGAGLLAGCLVSFRFCVGLVA